MAQGALAPIGQQQFFDDAGVVLNGGLLYWYITGTSTPTNTYQDVNLTTPYTNPITLNAAGRIPGGLYLDPGAGALKLIVRNALGTQIGTTIDPITPTNAGTAGLGQIAFFGGDATSPITTTTYPAGSTGDTLLAGSVMWSIDSATLAAGTYVIEATGQVTAGNTLTVAIMDLDDGAPNTPLATVAITTQVPSAPTRSAAITFALGGTAKKYGIKALVNAGTGFAWGVKCIRTA